MQEIQRLKFKLNREKAYQDCSDSLLQDFFHRPLKQEETAQRILNRVMVLSQSERGAIFSCNHGEYRMIAHGCKTSCDLCFLVELKKMIPQPESFSISLKDRQNTNSFLVNHLEDFEQDLCPEALNNFLTAHSYSHGELSYEMVLVNSKEDFQEDQLPWMEKFIELFAQINQKEQLQNALMHAQQELVDASQSKAQFLANVSHEIRSPLNGVICMASLLQDTHLDEEQLELLGIIQFSAENITRIIQDLLDLTQLSTGKMEIRRESFSLPEFFNGIVQNHRNEGEKKAIDFRYELQEGLKDFTGDRVRISQIISNLLNNAFKNTEKGEVSLSIRQENKELVGVVSDTGVGIPSEKLEDIFDQFVQ